MPVLTREQALIQVEADPVKTGSPSKRVTLFLARPIFGKIRLSQILSTAKVEHVDLFRSSYLGKVAIKHTDLSEEQRAALIDRLPQNWQQVLTYPDTSVSQAFWDQIKIWRGTR